MFEFEQNSAIIDLLAIIGYNFSKLTIIEFFPRSIARNGFILFIRSPTLRIIRINL